MTARKKEAEVRVVREKPSGEHKYFLGLVAMAVTALVASAPAWWLKAQLAETEAKIEAVKTAQLVSRQEIENALLRTQATSRDDTLGKIESLRKDIEGGFRDVRADLQDLKVRVSVTEHGKGPGR